MRLSKTQIDLLKILRDENTTVCILIASRGGPITFFMNIEGEDRNMRFDTVLKLAKLGLIENITKEEKRWRSSEYQITKAGISIIAKAA